MIIAEIGTAHSASLKKAKQLIDAAASAGADAVKFQWVYADELLHPDTGTVDLPCGSIRLYDRFKQLEVAPDFFADALAYAHKKELQFVCSPFGLRSLRELIAIRPDAIKIASPELNHFPLLRALADYRTVQKALGHEPLPVIISSGVSKLRDIENALDMLGKENVTLLHCITSYPAPEREYNVRLVQTLHDIFGVPCGISDHSLDPVLVPACAAACGSVTTEKHITLSKETDGLDDAVALDGEQFAHMVHALHQCEASMARYGKKRGAAHILKELRAQYGRKKVADVLGTGIKTLATSERENYGRTNRSLHFMREMKAGETITEWDIAILRTEKILTPGISPEYFETTLNTRLARDVQAGAGVRWEDIVQKQYPAG
ncbi:MAG: N-acetylneuraminate synthase family protein [Treponema sp.]|nr:N-acetylneuraminate synthase family protein [Treponema sp.]